MYYIVVTSDWFGRIEYFVVYFYLYFLNDWLFYYI